ncbi:MAG: hypothetical protein ABSE84_00525 [Isosphaeraceae bacterium]|jgi:hypothetical protein
MFLLVQNPGVAPVEGFTLLGVSTTRDCGVEGAIGQFGSGNKHAINVLLRAGLKIIVYCGKTRLDFQTRDDEIDDGLIRKPVKRVMCKLGGTSTRTIDLGWVLDFGAIDWTELGMSLREFVSNAIDRTLRQENGEFIPAMLDGRLAVVPVCDEKVKAKDGYTRVYVELNAGVQRYVDDLPKRFLHFSADPSQVKKSFLAKGDRNLNGKKAAVIYRAGVFVREIEENSDESVYDYNFKQDELQIDECRNASDYTVKAAIAKLYRRATAPELTPVFRALVAQKQVFEGSLDPHYICSSWDTPAPEQQQAWQTAWQAVAADAVMCGPSISIADFVVKKGYAAKIINAQGIVQAASRFGIKTDGQVLSENEKNGHEKTPATEAAQTAVDEVWRWLTKYNLTDGVVKPVVGCFRDVMNGGSRTLGFCDETGVYIADDQASALSKPLLKTALEECVHWVTKAGDNSRDLQDFAFRMIVEILTCQAA